MARLEGESMTAEQKRLGRPPTNQLAIFDLLVRAGKPMTLNEISDASSIKHFLVREAVAHLVDRGVVAGCDGGGLMREKVYFPVDAFRPEWEGVSFGEMQKIRANVEFAVDRFDIEMKDAQTRKREAVKWLKRIDANLEARKLAREGSSNVDN
jgi:hypothetical protein